MAAISFCPYYMDIMSIHTTIKAYEHFVDDLRIDCTPDYIENYTPIFGVAFRHNYVYILLFFTGCIQYRLGIRVDTMIIRKFCCVADKIINKRKTYLSSL